MSDKEKGTETSNLQQNTPDNNHGKPQSYGTENVQRDLNPSKPISYGTIRVVSSKTYRTNKEESNE